MFIYIVKKGDTIWKIANQYGVSPQRILTDNGLSNTNYLAIGQALIILIPETVYTVQPNDTLIKIATQYNTTVMALIQNNPKCNNIIIKIQFYDIKHDALQASSVIPNGNDARHYGKFYSLWLDHLASDNCRVVTALHLPSSAHDVTLSANPRNQLTLPCTTPTAVGTCWPNCRRKPWMNWGRHWSGSG